MTTMGVPAVNVLSELACLGVVLLLAAEPRDAIWLVLVTVPLGVGAGMLAMKDRPWTRKA